MASRTSIEWTDGGASWNPIRAQRRASPGADDRIGWHCEIVSPGCELCYAQAINKRMGTGLPYKVTQRAEISVYLDEKMLLAPLRWRRPRKIFVGSMTDLYGEWVSDEMLDRIFAIMALCPQHQFLLLTKRAERMRNYICSQRDSPRYLRFNRHELSWTMYEGGVPKHIWLGVSVEDQRRADERIPELLATPAAIWFVSYEPALGPVVLPPEFLALGKRAWVICGGESGPGARPMELAWARGLIAQCEAPAVPVFLKQLGSATGFNLHDRKGGDPSEWPSDLRVREYPQ